jgi:ubiquinone/menaquinone biosynthesis C-methylase UbiE
MSDYMLDKNMKDARNRLRIKESLQDPGTEECLRRIGIDEGWRCLEVGGGTGSVAAWLCGRVGTAGRVVATDINPAFLEKLGFSNLEVRKHDIASDPLETAAYDFVHARDVLMHLPSRDEVMKKMAGALKPGGWMLLEEPDMSTDMPDPTSPEAMQRLYEKVTSAVFSFLQSEGLDPYFGKRLSGTMRSMGFECMCGEGRLRLFFGGNDAITSSHMMAFGQLKESVVGTGEATGQEFDDFMALPVQPEFSWREGLTVSVWGRVPAAHGGDRASRVTAGPR